MGLIALTFRGLHSDVPELADDLDLLHRVVADEFEVTIAGEGLYCEVEFPVVELAQALDSWLRRGMPDRRELVFEPTGAAEPAALAFRPADSGWAVDSNQRATQAAPRLLQSEELREAAERFLHDLAAACSELDVDLNGMLQRLRDYSEKQR